jgi:hypothetical protein
MVSPAAARGEDFKNLDLPLLYIRTITSLVPLLQSRRLERNLKRVLHNDSDELINWRYKWMTMAMTPTSDYED